MAPTSRCLLAETSEGEPVGLVEAQRAGGDMEIIMIATARPFRRQGIATRMLGELLMRGKSEDVERMILEVAEDNAPARALYAAAEFTEVARRPDYYRNRKDGRSCDALLLAYRFASGVS